MFPLGTLLSSPLLSSAPCLEYKKLAVVSDDKDRTVSSGSVILYQGQSRHRKHLHFPPRVRGLNPGWIGNIFFYIFLLTSSHFIKIAMSGCSTTVTTDHWPVTMHTYNVVIFVMFRVYQYAAVVKFLMAELELTGNCFLSSMEPRPRTNPPPGQQQWNIL